MFKVEGENVLFWLRVKPRARREQLRCVSDELHLEVTAPAVEGQANDACVRYFTRALRLPQACVVILAGRKSRRKRLRITGHSAQETIAQLSRLCGA